MAKRKAWRSTYSTGDAPERTEPIPIPATGLGYVGGINLTAGGGGTGKTQAGIASAFGWLGEMPDARQVDARRRGVIYIDTEARTEQITNRMRLFAEMRQYAGAGRIRYMEARNHSYAAEELERTLAVMKADGLCEILVVWDSSTRIVNVNARDEVDGYFDALERLAAAWGADGVTITTLLFHHIAKSEKGEKGAPTPIGAAAWEDRSTLCVSMRATFLRVREAVIENGAEAKDANGETKYEVKLRRFVRIWRRKANDAPDADMLDGATDKDKDGNEKKPVDPTQWGARIRPVMVGDDRRRTVGVFTTYSPEEWRDLQHESDLLKPADPDDEAAKAQAKADGANAVRAALADAPKYKTELAKAAKAAGLTAKAAGELVSEMAGEGGELVEIDKKLGLAGIDYPDPELDAAADAVTRLIEGRLDGGAAAKDVVAAAKEGAGVGNTKAKNLVNALVARGVIERTGATNKVRYSIGKGDRG